MNVVGADLCVRRCLSRRDQGRHTGRGPRAGGPRGVLDPPLY